jgi:hypothetical protein
VRAFAEDIKRNFRVWSDSVVTEDSTSLNPQIRGGSGTQAHLWVGLGAEVSVTGSRFFDRDADTVIVDMMEGGGASATLVNTSVDVRMKPCGCALASHPSSTWRRLRSRGGRYPAGEFGARLFVERLRQRHAPG